MKLRVFKGMEVRCRKYYYRVADLEDRSAIPVSLFE
jgi:hypothetical protein